MSRGFPTSVTVALQKKRAAAALAKLGKSRGDLQPITLEGKNIAETFWGKAWCRNLEHYSDFASRLPRGRSYVRTGAVLDLSIAPTKVSALVQGSELYEIEINIAALDAAAWNQIVADCSGSIDSLVELLQGKMSTKVMEVVTRPGTGLFPAPKDITMTCTCPDWAVMCKHVAAALYGIGARLDQSPEVLFHLRQVDPTALQSAGLSSITTTEIADSRRLKRADLSELFGIEIEDIPLPEEPPPQKPKRRAAKSKKR